MNMTLLMDVSSIVSMVNTIILVVLLAVYANIYRKTGATFTIGLMVFAGMLMLHNIIAIYGYFAMAPLFLFFFFPFFGGKQFRGLGSLNTFIKAPPWAGEKKTPPKAQITFF